MPRHPYGPARIGLLGGECTGKTTLALALAASLPACLVDETLRRFVEQHGRTPDVTEQAAIMADQQEREDRAAVACRQPWLVADPAPLMTAVYSVVYFADESLVTAGVDLARAYDVVAWCDIDLPWTPDGGQRDGPDFRARAHDVIATIVQEHLEPRGVQVVRCRGSVADRVAAVGRAWQP
jgi:nicotinamide riboside kinase